MFGSALIKYAAQFFKHGQIIYSNDLLDELEFEGGGDPWLIQRHPY